MFEQTPTGKSSLEEIRTMLLAKDSLTCPEYLTTEMASVLGLNRGKSGSESNKGSGKGEDGTAKVKAKGSGKMCGGRRTGTGNAKAKGNPLVRDDTEQPKVEHARAEEPGEQGAGRKRKDATAANRKRRKSDATSDEEVAVECVAANAADKGAVEEAAETIADETEGHLWHDSDLMGGVGAMDGEDLEAPLASDPQEAINSMKRPAAAGSWRSRAAARSAVETASASDQDVPVSPLAASSSLAPSRRSSDASDKAPTATEAPTSEKRRRRHGKAAET